MMRYIGKIVCLHSFQTVKVDRFVERKVEQKKVTIFLSYLISSHSPGERGGSVVECRTLEQEVGGSKPTAAVLCP